ncbi:hypothetical protein BN973_05640 [Mycobacterium triplex]|uniref:Uncharacterized protein n=1 Tax=Mycobacterium triplex TaxID=47839 RepID=A0A024K6Z3_9MYCO|nr:hypothetical protein BN973_05640 [Mycobacterium triplex]
MCAFTPGPGRSGELLDPRHVITGLQISCGNRQIVLPVRRILCFGDQLSLPKLFEICLNRVARPPSVPILPHPWIMRSTADKVMQPASRDD